MRRLIRQLDNRGVLRIAGLYAAAAFVVLQVADLVLPALPLPESTYDVVVMLTVVGFPIVVVLAWFFDVTPEGVRRSPGGLEAYEESPASSRGVKVVSVAMILALVVVAGGLLAFRTIFAPARDADRVALAAFPFAAATAELAEGIPDLLLMALDGAEPLRVLDPWSLWTVLRDRPGDAAEAPDPDRAGRIASDRGAHSYLLGAVLELGGRVELVVRLYRTGRTEPVESFRVGGRPEEMAALVDRLAVQVMNRVAGHADPSLTTLQRNATSSVEALKAYLAARAAMRRGAVDSAVTAIDRAVALDSTFALAWLDGVGIYSWAQSMRGEFFTGLFEKLDRAEAHADSLTGRNRLRLEASRAMVSTDGATAASALNRIIEMDSTDLQAWAGLTYCHIAYGWQYGSEPEDALRAAERVLALDSSYVPAHATRARLGFILGDTTAVRESREALEAIGGDSHLGRSALSALRAVSAPDSALPGLSERLARRGVGEWVEPYRYLRAVDPDRAEIMTRAAAGVPDPQISGRVGGERLRLDLARGRLPALGRDGGADRYGSMAPAGTRNRFLLAATLVGAGDSTLAVGAAEDLTAALPPDSALAWWETYPVWWTAWLLGAWHGQMGDTVRARAWQELIDTFPAGGTSADYRGALQADIDARILARSGDLDAAIDDARRAMELWSIHTEADWEALPSPQMRFHLASLLTATGEDHEAVWLFQSLIPPTSWFGFLTARSHFELGALAEARGDRAAARLHYERALALWGPAEGAAIEWRDQAARALARVVAE